MSRRGVFPLLSIRSQYNIQSRNFYNVDELSTGVSPEFTLYVSAPTIEKVNIKNGAYKQRIGHYS